jgi:hypothetical protein
MSELHSWLSEQTNAQDMRPHRFQFFTSATSVQGHSRRLIACQPHPLCPEQRTPAHRPGMSELCPGADVTH